MRHLILFLSLMGLASAQFGGFFDQMFGGGGGHGGEHHQQPNNPSDAAHYRSRYSQCTSIPYYINIFYVLRLITDKTQLIATTTSAPIPSPASTSRTTAPAPGTSRRTSLSSPKANASAFPRAGMPRARPRERLSSQGKDCYKHFSLGGHTWLRSHE